MSRILDISEWQVPTTIDYQKVAQGVDLVIVRVQYGSNYIDKYYQTHIREFKKYGIPVAVYAWVRGVNRIDMEQEANDFYQRAKEFDPCFWWLDVEEESMTDMREGCSAYLQKLKALGAKRVGIYIAHHLYKKFNLNVAEADGIWIPHYGMNDGTPNSQPEFACDLHQYTSVGKLSGYSGHLDLNRLLGSRNIEWFTNTAKSNNSLPNQEAASKISVGDQVSVQSFATHYATGESIPDWVKNSSYKVIEIRQKKQSNSDYQYLMSSINSWVLEQDIKVEGTSQKGNVYVVQNGDNLWSIAEKVYGVGADYPKLKAKNGLTSDIIQPNQHINY